MNVSALEIMVWTDGIENEPSLFITALGVEAKIPPGIVKPTETKPPVKEKESAPSDQNCSCDSGSRESSFSDADAEQLIEFEDELHNTVYVSYVLFTNFIQTIT